MQTTFIHKSPECSNGRIFVAVETMYFSPTYRVASDRILPQIGEIGVARENKIIPIVKNTVLPPIWLCTSCEKQLDKDNVDEIYGQCSVCGELHTVDILFTSQYGGICTKCFKKVKKQNKKESSGGRATVEEVSENESSREPQPRRINFVSETGRISTGSTTTTSTAASTEQIRRDRLRSYMESADIPIPDSLREPEEEEENIFEEAALHRAGRRIGSNLESTTTIAQAMFETNVRFTRR